MSWSLHAFSIRPRRGISALLCQTAAAVATGAFLMTGSAIQAAAAPAKDIDPAFSHHVSFTVQKLEDPQANKTLGDASSALAAGSFKNISGGPAIEGSRSAVWLAIKVDAPEDASLILKLKNPLLRSVQLFEQIGGSWSRTVNTGAYLPRPIPNRVFYLPLSALPANRTVLLRVTSTTGGQIPLRLDILNQAEAFADINQDAVKTGLFYGVILVMVLYNLLLLLFIRQRVYLFYTAFLTTFCLHTLTNDGLLGNFIATMGWRDLVSIVLSEGNVLLVTLYAKEFLGLRERSPLLNLSALAIATACLSAICLTPFISLSTALAFAYVMHLSVAPFLFWAGGYSAYRGFTPARFFLTGLSALVVAMVYALLSRMGILSAAVTASVGMDYATKVGAVFEMVFFSFALADRIKHAERSKSQADAALLEAEILRRQTLEQMATERELAAQYKAVAQVTQTMAHDVRKPLSMLKMGLVRLAAVADSPSETRRIALSIQTHVGKAYDDVSGLISDVLEVSTNGQTNLYPENQSLLQILAEALQVSFRYEGSEATTFNYELRHQALLLVDRQKVQRLLVNLLENARQAMLGKGSGRIWVRTRDVLVEGLPQIEIAIGNTNSYIADGDRAHLFELFFTKGKRGGTGLGLAICAKIVHSHGGTITCRSAVDVGTEFLFTLPAATDGWDSPQGALPQSGADVRGAFEDTLNTGSERRTA